MSDQHKTMQPLVAAILIIIGIFMGKYLDFGESAVQNVGFNYNPQTKFNQLVSRIQQSYVDDVNVDSLLDVSIVKFLEELDPHSTYIPMEEMQAVSENMQGNFDGIGVEFQLYKDTIVVVNAITGGPSEKVGIQSGDRIVRADTIALAGVGLKNSDVIKKLRGKKGTALELEIVRKGVSEPFTVKVIRDKIPLHSLDAAYMIQDEMAYIKINRFSATTYEEFHEALASLTEKGARKLILDLRGNPGGFLNAAKKMVDELLPEGKMIVYTEGKSRPRRELISTADGIFHNGEVVVLVDEGSASASEIVAGAVQDNDRGTVVGRRTYGKGLVQEQWEMYDGSALRLTTSRYYTPTGRSIQKSYDNGFDAYRHESLDRYSNGELYHVDSVKVVDSLKYVTPGGKIVYGGGGIMPDVFVPLDTMGRSTWLYELIGANVINNYSFRYADEHRELLSKEYSLKEFVERFKITDQQFEDLLKLAEKEGVENPMKEVQHSRAFVENRLKSLIARKIWGDDGLFWVLNTQDNDVKKAIELLNKLD